MIHIHLSFSLSLSLSPHPRPQLATEHRAEFLPVLITVLYSKIVARKNKGAAGFAKNTKDVVGARRAAVFAYFTAMAPSELAPLFDILLDAFLPALKEGQQLLALQQEQQQQQQQLQLQQQKQAGSSSQKASRKSLSSSSFSSATAIVSTPAVSQTVAWRDAPIATQLGFLKVFGELVHQMRTVIRDYLPPLLATTLYLLEHALSVTPETVVDGGERERYRDVSQQCFRRVAECLDAYAAIGAQNLAAAHASSTATTTTRAVHYRFDTAAFLDPFMRVAAPSVQRLAAQGTQQRSGLLDALVIMSRCVCVFRV